MIRYASLRQGLVGAWCPSLGASGFRLIDRSGYNNHGTLTNMDPATDCVPASGKVALDFDGTDDFVDCGRPSAVTAAKCISASIWVNPQVATRSDLFGQWASPSQLKFILLQGVVASQFGFYVSQGTNPTGVNGFTFAVGTWYHVCGVYDQSTITLFVNGVLAASSAYSFVINDTNTTNLLIGKSGDAIGRSILDDVLVYNRALTPSEISLLYTIGRGGVFMTERSTHRRKTFANRRRRIICGANC